MRHITHRLLLRLWVVAVAFGVAAGCTTTSAQHSRAPLDRQTLESMLAPIALYPDALLSQVLMAATYPDEIAEAARWSRERPGLTGDAAVRSSVGWDWDPSVRSLLAFPQVLDTMARNMRWTEDLGDAFLDQRWDVMDAVQRLRRRAYEAGTLRSDDYVRVIDSGYEIAIEAQAPQVVHVPYYDPVVIYGSWWWPSRPPMFWPRWPSHVDPPGRPQHPIHWGPGISVSAGFFFGGFVWPRREVRVINTSAYYYPRTVVVERRIEVERPAQTVTPPPRRDATPGVWMHDPTRRRPPEARQARRADEPKGALVAPRPSDRREPPAASAPGRAPPVSGPAASAPSQGAPSRPSELKPAPGPRRERESPAPPVASVRGTAPVATVRESSPSPRSGQAETNPRANAPTAPAGRSAARADRDDAERAAVRTERRNESRTPPGATADSPARNRPEGTNRPEGRSEPGRADPGGRGDDGRRAARRSADAGDRGAERDRAEAPARPSEPGTVAPGPTRGAQRAPEGVRATPNR